MSHDRYDVAPRWDSLNFTLVIGEADECIKGNNVIWSMDNHDPWRLVQEGDDHFSLKISTFRFMLPLCDSIPVWVYCFDYYFLYVYLSIWILLTSWWVVISGSLLRIMASDKMPQLLMSRCTGIWILQGIYMMYHFNVMFQLQILDGKVSPKVWWECHLHKWLIHMKVWFMVLMMKWRT